MDPFRNPYNPGAGTRPKTLVGREREIEEFDLAVRRLADHRSAKSVMLTGLRGVGKTVLLGEFGRIARRHGWEHNSLEVNDGTSVAAAMASLVRQSTLRISATKRSAEKAKRILGVLKSFQMTWKLPGDVTIETSPFAGVGDSGDLESDLADLLVEIGELARANETGVAFTIDELQYLPRDQLAALVSALHRVAQEEVPVLIAGAGLPSLLGLVGDAKSYAERLFTFESIGSLSDIDARLALSGPSSDEGVTWEVAALDLLLESTEGYPYFLQEFGSETWRLANGPAVITLDDATRAIPIATAVLDDGFFRVRIDRLNDTDRQYLRAMASLGRGPYLSGDIAKQMGKKTTQVGPYRDSLIRRGLCFSGRHNEIDFTVPMFDNFVRRAL